MKNSKKRVVRVITNVNTLIGIMWKSEETIKFMREKQQKFREYIAAGGDPAKIKNIYDIK